MPWRILMKRLVLVTAVLLAGLSYWAWQGMQIYQAYQLAHAELEVRPEITGAIGAYQLSYDWWQGAYRALRYRDFREFEFHLQGESGTAVAAVNMRKAAGWEITCVNVVNGEYLNNRIIQDC